MGLILNIQEYQYVKNLTITQKKWPEIPPSILYLWQKHFCKMIMPNSCFINLYYFPKSSLGLHQDEEGEKDLNNAVL